MKLRGKSRGAISSIVVEIILIAVALVLSFAFGGFYFGLLGTAAHPSEVAARVAYCQQAGPEVTCAIDLTNLGAGNTATAQTCQLGSAEGVLSSEGTIPANGNLVVQCTVPGVTFLPGTQLVGSIPLTNGWTVHFTGTAS